MMHLLNTVILLACVFCWIKALNNSFNVVKQHEKQQRSTSQDHEGSYFKFWKGKTVADLNPILVQPEFCRDPWLSLLAFGLMLLGIFWWQMGYSLFADLHFADNYPTEHIPHYLVIRCCQHFFSLCLFLGFLDYGLKKTDARRSSKTVL